MSKATMSKVDAYTSTKCAGLVRECAAPIIAQSVKESDATRTQQVKSQAFLTCFSKGIENAPDDLKDTPIKIRDLVQSLFELLKIVCLAGIKQFRKDYDELRELELEAYNKWATAAERGEVRSKMPPTVRDEWKRSETVSQSLATKAIRGYVEMIEDFCQYANHHSLPHALVNFLPFENDLSNRPDEKTMVQRADELATVGVLKRERSTREILVAKERESGAIYYLGQEDGSDHYQTFHAGNIHKDEDGNEYIDPFIIHLPSSGRSANVPVVTGCCDVIKMKTGKVFKNFAQRVADQKAVARNLDKGLKQIRKDCLPPECVIRRQMPKEDRNK